MVGRRTGRSFLIPVGRIISGERNRPCKGAVSASSVQQPRRISQWFAAAVILHIIYR